MTNNTTETGYAPMYSSPDDGIHHHFLNHLGTVRVPHHATAAQMSVVEFTAPRGFGPPLHVHREEDELLYLIDGEIHVRAGEVDSIATAGSITVLPHAVPHTFQVLSPTARFLTVSSGSRDESSFDRFVGELGSEIPTTTLPAPVDIDPGHVAMTAGAHGIEILGPPPAPLS